MTRWWHDDVDASDTATSLVTVELTVDEAMLSTHGGRRQQHVNAGERCQEMARASDSDGEGDGDSDGVCDGDDDGDGDGLGVDDDRDGSGYVASGNGDNAGEQVMATAMATATATATATAMATATAKRVLAQLGDGMLTASRLWRCGGSNKNLATLPAGVLPF